MIAMNDMDEITQLDENISESCAKEKPHKSEKYRLETSKLNWKDGLSVYEGKMSVLIFGSLITLVFALVMYYLRKDISNNLTEIVEVFIFSIAGITSLETAVAALKDKGIFNLGSNDDNTKKSK